ncbi:cytochrome-c peroxidase [Methylobacterium bullatum]|uniref:Methylamine utilization protein MauG n=2 Tax=Methylobacterium bullatum TaxID=570505 RepID=A0AAV4Z7G2_9HYPH|nr:cytochrome c peroxidase [Methylobacterium bullatum]GJD39901.1 Cytochrome c551 peroxidase [Methylobacterium bullatum]
MTRKAGSAFGKAALTVSVAAAVGSGLFATHGMTDDATAWRSAFARPSALAVPDGIPDTEAQVELGRTLFFDPVLSRSRSISCATCHEPSRHWGDGRMRGIGEPGIELKLRTPTLLNVGWIAPLGWDGKFPDLESVAFTPITGPNLMNLSEEELIARLRADPDYVAAFAATFEDREITRGGIERALAAFQRTIVSGSAPFDRWRDGDASAIGASAKAGFALFNGKAGCHECHGGWAFTDGSFHDIGVGRDDDIGRGRLFPTSKSLQYAFKTPTLRDVAQRGPYMHDGSVATLRDVIDLYDRGGIERPSRSPKIRPLHLSETEKADLLAFLDTLTAAEPKQKAASK